MRRSRKPRKVNSAEFQAALGRLRPAIEAEIAQLDDLRGRLLLLLGLIDNYPNEALASSARSVKDLVTEHPGIRLSMLAMVLKRERDSVRVDLEGLQRDGFVVRDGLGWRAVG
jgi:hypothetical protein